MTSVGRIALFCERIGNHAMGSWGVYILVLDVIRNDSTTSKSISQDNSSVHNSSQ